MVKSELVYKPTASTIHFCIINLTLKVLTVKEIEIKMEKHKPKTIDKKISEIFSYVQVFDKKINIDTDTKKYCNILVRY